MIRYGSDDVVAVIDPALRRQARARRTAAPRERRADRRDASREALRVRAERAADRNRAQGRRACRRIGARRFSKRSPRSSRSSAACTTCSARIASFTSPRVAAGTTIWDVREPPDVPLFSGDVVRRCGADRADGRQRLRGRQDDRLARAGARGERAPERSARFVPTGQTGIMIAGWGISVDRVIADFAPGARRAARALRRARRRRSDRRRGPRRDQPSGIRPGDAGVDDRLRAGRAGSRSAIRDARRSSRTRRRRCGYAELIDDSRTRCSQRSNPPRSSASRSTRADSSEDEARAEIARARDETGLPADDVVRFGAAALLRRDRAGSSKRPPLRPRARVSARRGSIAAALALLRRACGVRATVARRAANGERNAWTIPGVLRLGEDEEPDSLNLMYAHTAATDTVAGLLFSFLLRYDARRKLHSRSRDGSADARATAASAATASASSCICAKASSGPTARR